MSRSRKHCSNSFPMEEAFVIISLGLMGKKCRDVWWWNCFVNNILYEQWPDGIIFGEIQSWISESKSILGNIKVFIFILNHERLFKFSKVKLLVHSRWLLVRNNAEKRLQSLVGVIVLQLEGTNSICWTQWCKKIKIKK